MDLAPVDHLADIEAVLEQVRERPHAKAPAADGLAVRQPPRLAAYSLPIEVLRQARMEPSSRYRAKIAQTAAASAGTTRIFLSTAA